MSPGKELTHEVKCRTLGTNDDLADVATNPDFPNYALLKSLLKIEDMHYDSEAGKQYGYVPRMRRCERVHLRAIRKTGRVKVCATPVFRNYNQ